MMERKNLIKEIRDDAKMGGVFRNRFILNEDYKPASLVARDEQIMLIKELLKPVLDPDNPDKPQNGVLYGLSGTGKTAVMNAFLDDLDAYMEEYEWHEVCHAYVNCHTPNLSTLLTAILWAVRGQTGDPVPMRGISPRELILKIFAEINRVGKRMIIVFDEIDLLSDKELDLILYPFLRPGHMYPFKPGVSVTVIGIANNTEFLKKIDPRDQSAIDAARIDFPKYNAPQLVEILEDRGKAFVDGALAVGVIKYCAALAAQDGGSARTAIQLLKKAGVIAERYGEKVVTEQHVKEAQVEINVDDTIKTVGGLPPAHQLLLAAIIALCDDAHKATFTSGDIYERYVEICAFMNNDALTHRRIYDLTKELKQLSLVEIADAYRGRYGITREITFTSHRDAVVAGIKKNPRLDEIPLKSCLTESKSTTLDHFT